MKTVLIDVCVRGPTGSGKTKVTEEIIRYFSVRAKVIHREEKQGEDLLTLEVSVPE